VSALENKEDRRGNRVNMYQRDSEEEDALIDKTAYGEFVSTFHGWTSFEHQLENTKRIRQITEKQG
jgi:hypothetical protein